MNNEPVVCKPVIFFECPDCHAKNTIGIFTDNISVGVKCKKCSSTHKMIDLIRKYSKSNCLDRNLFNDLCIEYICPNGHSNVIFNRILSNEMSEFEGSNKQIITSELPSFGLCEECMLGCDLIYKHSLPCIGLTDLQDEE